MAKNSELRLILSDEDTEKLRKILSKNTDSSAKSKRRVIFPVLCILLVIAALLIVLATDLIPGRPIEIDWHAIRQTFSSYFHRLQEATK